MDSQVGGVPKVNIVDSSEEGPTWAGAAPSGAVNTNNERQAFPARVRPWGHLTPFLGPEGTRRNALAVERCRLSSLSPRIGQGTGAPPVYGGNRG